MLLYFVAVGSHVALLVPIRVFVVFPNLILRVNSCPIIM
jgi:hypothetical protein